MGFMASWRSSDILWLFGEVVSSSAIVGLINGGEATDCMAEGAASFKLVLQGLPGWHRCGQVKKSLECPAPPMHIDQAYGKNFDKALAKLEG